MLKEKNFMSGKDEIMERWRKKFDETNLIKELDVPGNFKLTKNGKKS